MTDVARRAGIAKGTIYLYFDSKYALFEACIRSKVSPLIGGIEQMVDDYDGASDILLQMMLTRGYSELVESDTRVLLRIMIGEGHQFPELCKLHYEIGLKRGLAVVQRIIDRGIERGDFKPGIPQEYPRLLMSPCIAAAIWKMSFEPFDKLDMDSYIAGHLELMLNGLRH